MNIPDKIIITVTRRGHNIQALAAGQVVAEQTHEFDGECAFERNGDDLFEQLPPDLAVTLDGMDLMLMDASAALMPEAA